MLQSFYASLNVAKCLRTHANAHDRLFTHPVALGVLCQMKTLRLTACCSLQ